jgi:hypothetical protein
VLCLLRLLDQLNKRENFGLCGLIEDLVPFFGFQVLAQEILYHKVPVPAIHDFVAREAFVFYPAVRKAEMVAEPRAADFNIVSRGRAVFIHGASPFKSAEALGNNRFFMLQKKFAGGRE